jgi:hypothetical protein
MKTVKNITGFLFISLILSGCVENYDIPAKTEKGKAIYNSWHKGVDTVLSRYINIAFMFNAWHETADSQKDSIEDKYLPQFKIRDLGNDQWGLYSGAELAYRISRYNKSLSESNAFWVVEATNATLNGKVNNDNQNYYYSDDRYNFISFLNDDKTVIVLHTTGTNEWDIQVGYSLSNVQMAIHLKSMDDVPASLLESSFAMSTEGCFAYVGDYGSRYGNITYLDFETTEDLVFHYQNNYRNYQDEYDYSYPKKTFYWSAGKVSLNAMRSHDGDDVKTEASFSQLANSQFGISITYKGITEEWIETSNKW